MVVLGASGLIGARLVRALARCPVRVRAVGRTRPVPAVAGVTARSVDLTLPGRLAEAVTGADVVVHLVAHTVAGWRVADGDALAERVNVGLVRDLVDVVAPGRAPVVVFASTAGEPGGSAYGRHKLAAELALAAATRAGRVRGISLRLPTVYGTADGTGVVARMIRLAAAGEPLPLWGEATGRVERDLLHVDDAVTALLAAIAHANALAGRYWTVGTGTGVRVADLFAAIAAAVAEHQGRDPVPVVVVESPATASADDHRGVVADPVAFHAVTGWVARVPLAAGIASVVRTCCTGTPPGSGLRC